MYMYMYMYMYIMYMYIKYIHVEQYKYMYMYMCGKYHGKRSGASPVNYIGCIADQATQASKTNIRKLCSNGDMRVLAQRNRLGFKCNPTSHSVDWK